jgi:hypothetical protein
MTEYYDALGWYLNIGPHLSQRFAQAVEDTVQTIASSPLRFAVVHKRAAEGWRSAFSLWAVFPR